MISFGEVLPIELQLGLLSDLIYSRDFPSSLVRFTQVDFNGSVIGRDRQIWRQALQFYFPFINDSAISKESNYTEQVKDTPFQLFKTLYKRCAKILKSENVTFADYVKAMLNEWDDIPVKKHPVLIGLSIAAGQKIVFSNEQLAKARNYSFLFSAALGNRTTFLNIMNDAVQPNSNFKCRALVISTECGQLTLCAYLLSHAQADLSRHSLSEAFLNACTLGYHQIVKLFLTPPLVQMLVFHLPKALYLACMQGNTIVVVDLLNNPFLKTNYRALNEAITCAVTYAQLEPLNILLQEDYLKKNLLLMIDLLKMSVARSHPEMTGLILRNANVTFSQVVISDAIQQAINNADDETVLVILKSRLAIIAPYARRKILYSFAEKGREALINYLLENDQKTFDSANIGQVLRLAASNNHTELVISLMRKYGDKISESDKNVITTMPCYHSSSLLKTLLGYSDIAELTTLFDQVSLVDCAKTELNGNSCLVQYGYVKACVKGIDAQAKQSGPLSYKNRF